MGSSHTNAALSSKRGIYSVPAVHIEAARQSVPMIQYLVLMLILLLIVINIIVYTSTTVVLNKIVFFFMGS